VPVPELPAVTSIHDALLAAVQAQLPSEAVTVTLPDAAADPTESAFDERVYVQIGAVPLCVIVNVSPAMVMVPVLLPASVLASTLYETVPVPVPASPAVTVIQESLLTAVQEQALSEGVTMIFPIALEVPKETVLVERAYVHGEPQMMRFAR